jgi:2-methylcitrate dehydratase PrpD
VNGNKKVAEFVRSLRWEELPAAVQEKAKLCLLDVLGATVSGTMTRISQITADYAAQAWKGNEATILLHNRRSTAAGAAFANGYAANGFDTDDGADHTKGHPGAQLFPTALALSERLGKTGKELLTSMVVGYEVAIRMGRCWHDDHEIWQACASWGSVASVAAAAHLLGLDVGSIQHALGIADYYAPNVPMMRDIDDPAMVKHGIGWGAMTGIMAAELASAGFTGVPSLLGFEEYRDWVLDIGEEYLILDAVWFKEELACCGFAHSAIYAAEKILQQHTVPVDEIEHILVEGYHETVRLGDDLPTTTEEAQFNTAWPVAAFIMDGEVGPRQMLEKRLSDPELVALAEKIEVVESERFSEWARLRLLADPEGKYAARVKITLKDGTCYDSGDVAAFSLNDAAWDRERVADKFRWLVEDVLSKERMEDLIETTWAFDQIEDVRDFATSLAS